MHCATCLTEPRGRGDTDRIPKYDYIPAGRLRIDVHDDRLARGSWSDTAKQRLDRKLGHVVVSIEAVAAERRLRREEGARRRREEEQRQQQEAEQRAKAKHQQRLMEYRELLAKELRRMAIEWEKARRIQEFLDAYEVAMPEERRTDVSRRWLESARRYAGQLDPLRVPEGIALCRRIVPLLRWCGRFFGGCPGDEAYGLCRRTPEACTDIYDPVCGSDGETYSNCCYANAAGVAVSRFGACEGSCTSDADCETEEFCQSRGGACGAGGTCTARPEVCTRIFDPVCGCDGNTYSNACVAAAAGVSVASDGECVDAPACGGFPGTACPFGGTCVDDPGDDCDPEQGGADCIGLCECDVLGVCTEGQHWDSSPYVCGCVPDENPCSVLLCPRDMQCVVRDGSAVCQRVGGGACGAVTCGPGLECCNASCGICTPPDGVCIQLASE